MPLENILAELVHTQTMTGNRTGSTWASVDGASGISGSSQTSRVPPEVPNRTQIQKWATKSAKAEPTNSLGEKHETRP